MTVRKVEEQLGPRVAGLVSRLKEKRYKTPLVKRQYIDKGGGKRRPFGFPSFALRHIEGSRISLNSDMDQCWGFAGLD